MITNVSASLPQWNKKNKKYNSTRTFLRSLIEIIILNYISASWRYFLNTSALVILLAIIPSCSKDNEPVEQTASETPVPIITGPSSLTIPVMGGSVEGIYDSKSSTGGSTSQTWKLLLPDSGIEEELVLGYESTVNFRFSRPGKYKIKLAIFNNAKFGITEKEIVVNPADHPADDYEIPMLIMVNESFSGVVSKAYETIYLLYLSNMKMVRLFGAKELEGTRLSSDPTGRYILFSIWTDDFSVDNYSLPNYPIFKYDLLTGQMIKLTTSFIGNAMNNSWSPTGTWIVYSDMSRPYKGLVGQTLYGPEIALLKPDGSQQLFIGVSDLSKRSEAYQISWSPDETSLAYGSSGFLDQNFITICKDIYNGNTVKTYPFPSYEQLDRFLQAGNYGMTIEEFNNRPSHTSGNYEYNIVGNNGVAWSPDGQKIVYDLSFGTAPLNYNILVQSNADLSGDIEILAMSKGDNPESEFYFPHCPTWSRDGKTLYFIAYSHSKQHLFKINPLTKEKEMLLESVSIIRAHLYN